MSSLPIIASWHQSRAQLFARLGLIIFLLIGLQWTLSSYWMDAAFRLVHSLEVLVDAFGYTAILMWLFAKEPASHVAKVERLVRS